MGSPDAQDALALSTGEPSPFYARLFGERNVDAPALPQTGDAHPLGFALAQLHGIYVLAQNRAGLVLVDMHAAHERIVYEKLKGEYAGSCRRSRCWCPRRSPAEPVEIATADEYDALDRFGFDHAHGASDARRSRDPVGARRRRRGALARGVLHDLRDHGGSGAIDAHRDELLSSMACRRGPREPAARDSRDERAASRDGSDRARRPVQPRPADVVSAHVAGARSAVHARGASRKLPFMILLMGPTASGGARSRSRSPTRLAARSSPSTPRRSIAGWTSAPRSRTPRRAHACRTI